MRIIVDEAHSSFLSESYRPKMQALIHLQQATAPKIFLTATLVPEHQNVLAACVGISLERTLVLRLPTARPNHRLQLAAIPRLHKPLLVGFRLASLLLEAWHDDSMVRGIIFVRSIKKLEKAFGSSPFPVCTYHGDMSNQEKETQLDRWLSDKDPARWMISTTALLHGVDYPRVDAVIFLEHPFGLYDFVQGAGRAGRSGQESFIAVVHNGPPFALPDENQYGCRLEMENVLGAAMCRRASISKVMDGQEVSCSGLPNSLLCDFCEKGTSPLITNAINSFQSTSNPPAHSYIPRSPPRPPPASVLTGFAAQANAGTRKCHAERVRDLMERFSGCFVCRIGTDDHTPCHPECGSSGVSGCSITPHRVYSCSDFKYKNGWMDWKKKSIAWPKDVTRCYFCGFPASVAGYDHKSDNNKYPGICRFSDTAIAAAWHILNTPQLLSKLKKDLGFVPKGDEKIAFGAWLTGYGSESEDIRLLSVFSWLCHEYYPNSAAKLIQP